MEYIIKILLLALAVAFLYCFFDKVGVIPWVQRRGNQFFSKMANCLFCSCFWIGFVVSVAAFAFIRDWQLLLLPVFSTVLSIRLITYRI